MNKTTNITSEDYEKYLNLEDALGQDKAPQWNDPATRYFKNALFENEAQRTVMNRNQRLNRNLGITTNNHFLYPLCNSPKRKEYYREVLQNHKEELQKQIARNFQKRVEEKMNSYLKGDTSIPISDTYNPDFDRMQKQFKKFAAISLNNQDPSLSVRIISFCKNEYFYSRKSL